MLQGGRMKKNMLLGFLSLAVGSVYTTSLHAENVRYIPGELIVKFKAGKSKSFFQSKSINSLGLAPKREIKLSYGTLNVLKLSNEKSFGSVLEALKTNPDIEFAEPNYIYSTQVMPVVHTYKSKPLAPSPFYQSNVLPPDDPGFVNLWGLNNTGSNEPQGKVGVEGADINALKAWDITKGDHKVRIAVIDTGVDYNHQDLAGNVDGKSGYNFVNNTDNAMDDNGHGTHCAGTIGALHGNKTGVAGVMSDVTIIPIKFLDAGGSGSLDGAVRAIDYATQLNVDIMSNSWGGGGRSQALYEAINHAAEKGILFTAAAGNSSSNNDMTPSYPASYDSPNIIAVAALTAQNDLAYFSSYGRTSVHIAAPGHNILSTIFGNRYEIMSGTSMATPHVSGVLGLLIAKEGRLSLDVVRERVVKTGVPVTALKGKVQTGARIDAYNLLTDTRPTHSGPSDSAWQTVVLDDQVESEHPYRSNINAAHTIKIPGAKYIRLKFEKFEMETGYDYVRLADLAGNTIEKVSGVGSNYVTEYAEGDSMVLNFVTDRSINKWGFIIKEVEVQY